MATEFGNRLKEARKHAKLTQKELAEKAGLSSQGTIAELESKGSGSAYTSQIAIACKVNPNWLATGSGEMLDRLVVAVNQDLAYAGIAAQIPIARAGVKSPPPLSIQEAMAALASYLEQMDDDARRSAAGALRDLAAKPETHVLQAALVSAAFQSRREKAA
jgi:transcriptional regulator with XRE-family HTH domain